MGLYVKRQIGQILMDGGFLKENNLERACEEQKRTHELLGQVLVRMGVLKEQHIKTPLLIQGQLSSIDDAVRVAAGERQLLGVLLVESGKITNKQLDAAIAEQKLSGDKLGEVFERLGLLSEKQLEALLAFQHNQGDTTVISPLRLGELLVATGYISREQLENALLKQHVTHKKIGEVLVEEGYITPRNLKDCFRLQKMLVKSVLAAILSLGLGAPAMAANVSLQWDPNTDANLAGYKLYYSPDTSSLAAATPIDVGLQTTTSLTGLDPSHSYQFAVTAYNASGVESSFSNILTLVEQQPPTVGITSPLNAANVSGVVSVSVSASDNVGVTKVEFYVNGVLKATDTASPYTYSWDTTTLAAGTYTLTVKAYDAAGNVSQSSSTVNVVSDTIPPTVTMTSPANNATLSGTVTISSSASDNVGVTLVEFYSNGVLLSASNVVPYSYSWDTTKVANGNYSLYTIAKDNSGNSSQSSTVTVTVNNQVTDTTAPTVLSFTMPSTSSSLTVPVSGLGASDNVGVAGYLISESATKPSASDSRWSGSVPASFIFSSAGIKTAYAWAKDAAGNVSNAKTATVKIFYSSLGSDIAPLAAVSVSSENTSTGQLGVKAVDGYKTGYPSDYTKEWATLGQLAGAWIQLNWPQPYTIDTIALYDRPNTSDQIQNATLTFSDGSSMVVGPLSNDGSGDIFTFPQKTVTWVKLTVNQAVGSNVGLSEFEVYGVAATDTSAPTDTIAPTISSFSLPTASTSLTVSVVSLAASDNMGVSGYIITESSSPPSATATGWSATPPANYSFSGAGTKTAYAWAKDAAGNVSASRSATVVITLPDTTAPSVLSFTLPSTSSSLTVPVTGFGASDNVGVTGYLVSESSAPPLASDSRWNGSVPTSITFSSAGTKTAYAWAKDAAGNISASRSATVVITLGDVTAPTLVSFKLPTSSKSLTVPITSLSATDNVGVTGYLISESATRPLANDSRWTSTAPTSFTFSSAGTKTAYVWAKDAAGNVSGSLTASVKITLR